MGKLNKVVLIYLMPIICGFTAANMYYIQPLTSIVSNDLNISYEKTSMLYSFSLAGNAISLCLIIPLGDFYSKRKLISFLYVLLVVSLLIIPITGNYYILSAATVLIGIGVSSIPLITAGLSNQMDGTEHIGRIMSGVLLGILFSRFASSIFSEIWGWGTIYVFSALIMLISLFLIYTFYPESNVKASLCKWDYSLVLCQNFKEITLNAVVRHYCVNAFVIMFLFSAYWSNVSIYLVTVFRFTQSQVGYFSLTGIAGASSALFSARILKMMNYKNNYMYFLMATAFFISGLFEGSLIVSISGALLIDAFIQLIHVNNQRGLFLSCQGNEARAASCYMLSFVTGGAIGGFTSSCLYAASGWNTVMIVSALIALIPLFSQIMRNFK